MDLHTGTPFWPLKDGQPATYPPLRENEECEILVIGGGVGGALIVHALTNAGVNTLLVDRRDIATGSTAASTSLLQYEPDEPLHRLAKLRGEAEAVSCYRACREALTELGKLAQKLGAKERFATRKSLLLASQERDVKALLKEFSLRNKHALPVEFWSRKHLQSRSSLPHAGALLCREAAVVDTYALTHALIRAAKSSGLHVFERTSVTQVHRQRSGLTVQTNRHFKIRSKKLVIAAGYESTQFLRRTWGTQHLRYRHVTGRNLRGLALTIVSCGKRLAPISTHAARLMAAP